MVKTIFHGMLIECSIVGYCCTGSSFSVINSSSLSDFLGLELLRVI